MAVSLARRLAGRLKGPAPGSLHGPPSLPLYGFPQAGNGYLTIDHHPLPWHEPAGEIYGARTQAQSFLCQQENIAGLDLYLGTYGRRNKSYLYVSLHRDKPDGPIIFETREAMAGLKDNQALQIRFEPLGGLKGQRLWLTLAAPEAAKGGSVTAWANRHLEPAGGGQWLVAGRPQPGSLAFRTWAIEEKPLLPQLLYVEFGNRCNIRCIHCFWQERRRVFQKLEPAWLESLEPVLGRVGLVESGSEGEVLYDDELGHQTLDYLLGHAKGYTIHMTTNGTMLNDRLAGRLVEGQRVARVFFSVDGATPQSYNSIRKGADFDQVIANIKRLKRRKDESRLPGPGIGLSMVGMRRNIEELPAMVDLAARLGADLVTVLPLIVGHPKLDQEGLHHYPELSNANFARAKERGRELGVAVQTPEPFSSQPLRRGHKPCWRPWTFAFIGSNGDVLSCCHPASVMGNLGEQKFEEIWLGERYQALRERINTPDCPEMCLDCPDHNFRLTENRRSFYSYSLNGEEE